MRLEEKDICLATLHLYEDYAVFKSIFEKWGYDNYKVVHEGVFPRYKMGKYRCPLGYLFDEGDYNAVLMEKHSWTELVERGLVPSDHMEMLQDIQNIHDQAINEKDFELARIEILRGLLSVSKKYCLGFTQDIVDEINEYTACLENGYDN